MKKLLIPLIAAFAANTVSAAAPQQGTPHCWRTG